MEPKNKYRSLRRPVGLVIWFVWGLTSLLAQDWYIGSSLNIPRTGAPAVVLNGSIYVIGGKSFNNKLLNSVEKYDSLAHSWDLTGVDSLHESRVNAAAIVYDNKIYVLGGRDERDMVLRSIESYDPLTNEWRGEDNMLQGREGHSAVILNNHICVMGGIDSDGFFIREIEWHTDDYDWENSSTRMDIPRAWAFATTWNNVFYMFGGLQPTPTALAYEAEVDSYWRFSWEQLASLKRGRGNGALAVLEDKLFIIGGNTVNGASDSVEIFNFHTQQLEEGPVLPTPRIGMAAAALNRKIYVLGGYINNPDEPLSLVEVYSPSPVTTATLANPETVVPERIAHISGYPNPFNGIIQLQVQIPVGGENEIAIYDVRGHKIKSVFRGRIVAGQHSFRWNGNGTAGNSTASGIYFAVLKGKNYLRSVKIVYVQ